VGALSDIPKLSLPVIATLGGVLFAALSTDGKYGPSVGWMIGLGLFGGAIGTAMANAPKSP